MRVVSLFSGAGGLDLGLERAGHEIVAMCEIDRIARSVLRRHWPDVPLHDDVTTFPIEEHRGRTDLVAGGSPCQDLSVGGARDGLAGVRSGLFWHQCRVADSVLAEWVLWENVPGALSSNDGRDFAAVLWGLTGARIDVPKDGWRSFGVCRGIRRSAVWRVLDARSFGTPQARRRVFVVAGPHDRAGPALLLEPKERGGRPSTDPATGGGAPVLGGDPGDTRWYRRIDSASYRLAERSTSTLLARDTLGRGADLVIDSRGPRDLDPVERERLMTWPDDWTSVDHSGSPLHPNHRYRLTGNGVVANLAEWVGRQLLT